MSAFVWIVLSLAGRIILAQDTDCDLSLGESCFFARIDLSSPINYNEAVAYCESQGGVIAPIKSADIQAQLAENLRTKIKEEKDHIRLWVATKIDINRNLSPEGSYAKWYPSFPLTSYGRFYDVDVFLVIRKDANSRYHGMINTNTGRKLHGVICEKYQEPVGVCDSFSTTGLTYWIQTDNPKVTQQEAEAECQAGGGTLAVFLSDEHYKCFPRLVTRSLSLWTGYRKGPGETRFTTRDGSEPSYIEAWLNESDVRSGPGDNGVVTYMNPNNFSPLTAAQLSSFKLDGGICQKQEPDG